MTCFNKSFFLLSSTIIFILSLPIAPVIGSNAGSSDDLDAEDNNGQSLSPLAASSFEVHVSDEGSSTIPEASSTEPVIEHHVSIERGTDSPPPNPTPAADPTLTASGRATRFTDIPNTIEDDAARAGVDFWAVGRNLSGAAGIMFYAMSSVALKVSQTTWVSSAVSQYLVTAAAVWGTTSEAFAFVSGSCEVLRLKHKKQAEALAKEYNEARGYTPHGEKDRNSELEAAV